MSFKGEGEIRPNPSDIEGNPRHSPNSNWIPADSKGVYEMLLEGGVEVSGGKMRRITTIAEMGEAEIYWLKNGGWRLESKPFVPPLDTISDYSPEK